MIHVERGKAPASLSSSKVKTEIKRATEFFTRPHEERAKHRFDFKLFPTRIEGVRNALLSMFHGKCAYCEADFESVMSGDVEHFRPKGGVLVGEVLKRGYYWLAASWDNLLISCKDCNSRRKQRIKGVKGRVPAGKLNQFPLADESRRARRQCDVADETPLLLNPYNDNPEHYLTYEFDDEGDILVNPSKKKGLARRKGETSIEVYALRRSGLVHSRTRLAKKIAMDIERLRDCKAELARNPENPWLERRLLQDLDELLVYTEPDQPYSAMARCLIDPVVAEMRKQPHNKRHPAGSKRALRRERLPSKSRSRRA